MKRGARALGIGESYRGERSTLAGAVVRADRVLDDLAFSTCTVGGTDATESIIELVDGLDRPDVRYVLIAGIAPAWYNLVDLPAVEDALDRPVISVSFEESDGLEGPIRETFTGDAVEERLAVYRRQPERHRLTVNDETVFVRSVGLGAEHTREVVRGFTPEGGRPDPIRIARLAARAGDRLWREERSTPQ